MARRCGSGQVVASCLDVGDKVLPPGGFDGQDRAVRVFGIADGDDTRETARNLDTVPATVAAVTGLVPCRVNLYTVNAAVAAVAGLAPRGGDLDAVNAAVAAVTGLPPAKAHPVFHRSAAFRITVRLAARGNASAWTRTKIFAALRTSDLLSVITSSTFPMASTSGAPSTLARLNAPLSPALAPMSVGITWILMFGRWDSSARWMSASCMTCEEPTRWCSTAS